MCVSSNKCSPNSLQVFPPEREIISCCIKHTLRLTLTLALTQSVPSLDHVKGNKSIFDSLGLDAGFAKWRQNIFFSSVLQQWTKLETVFFRRSTWSNSAERSVCAGTWGCKEADSSPVWWRSPSKGKILWWWSIRLERKKRQRSERRNKCIHSCINASGFIIHTLYCYEIVKIQNLEVNKRDIAVAAKVL